MKLTADYKDVLNFAKQMKMYSSSIGLAYMPMAKRFESRLTELLLQPTKNWEHTPEIRVKHYISADGNFNIEVKVEDKPYFYLNFGTPPHLIFRKNGTMLMFPISYIPKTSPQSLVSLNGGNNISTVGYARVVRHPGITARMFDAVAQKQLQKEVNEIVNHNFLPALFRFFMNRIT